MGVIEVKTKKFLCVGVIVTAVILFVIHVIPYSIAEDFSNMEAVQKQVNNRMPHGANVVLHEGVSTGKYGAIMMSVLEGDDEKLGLAILEKGLTGKFRVRGTTYGGGNYHWRVFQETEGDYCVLYGRNEYSDVNRIDITYGHSVYQFYPPRQPYFIMKMYFGEMQEDAWIDPSEVRFYNLQGNDITDAVIR